PAHETFALHAPAHTKQLMTTAGLRQSGVPLGAVFDPRQSSLGFGADTRLRLVGASTRFQERDLSTSLTFPVAYAHLADGLISDSTFGDGVAGAVGAVRRVGTAYGRQHFRDGGFRLVIRVLRGGVLGTGFGGARIRNGDYSFLLALNE